MIKIYKLFVNTLFVAIIALLLIYFVFRVTDKVEIYRVKTGSMEEKIHVGDYIMIYRKDNYNVGEIVTYISNDGFITHRIIRKEGDRVITKGDANNTEDREILASTIIGEAILVGGVLNIVINYKYVIVCILISLYLFSCYFGDSKDKENNEDDSSQDETSTEKENDEEEKIEELENSIKEEKKEENELKEKTEDVVETKEEKEEIDDGEKPLIKKKNKKEQ